MKSYMQKCPKCGHVSTPECENHTCHNCGKAKYERHIEFVKPPRGGGNIKKPCEHKYIHLETRRQEGTRASFGLSPAREWKRTDVFFCEKCLDEVEKVKTAEGYEDRPYWW